MCSDPTYEGDLVDAIHKFPLRSIAIALSVCDMNDEAGILEPEEVVQILQEEMDVDEELLEELFDESSSDEEETEGKRKGKAPNKERDFVMAHAQLVHDYFNGRQSTYD